jgi:hypothetical protein
MLWRAFACGVRARFGGMSGHDGFFHKLSYTTACMPLLKPARISHATNARGWEQPGGDRH